MADNGDLRGAALYEALIRLKPDGLTETDWAAEAGLNRGFFSNLKAGHGSPRSISLRKLLERIGRSEAELYGGAAATPVAEQPIERTVDAGETVQIARLNLSLPMGQGATVDDYIEEEPFTFDLGYVRSFTRTPPSHLRLALGVGDSMFPTLMSSDLVWIDSTQRILNQSDRIWAVSINGAAAIKRLRPLRDDRVLVMSDNKAIGDYEVGRDEILIGGRVIRFARDV